MLTTEMIITNNIRAYEEYDGRKRVHFMEGSTQHEVFIKVLELVRKGARLQTDVITEPESYYRTIGLYFDEEEMPLEEDMTAVERALDRTDGADVQRPFFDTRAQKTDVKRYDRASAGHLPA